MGLNLRDVFIASDGVKIIYEDEGEGKAILMVHGWGATSRFWRDIREALLRKYRVVTFDLRGHGESDKPVNVDYSIYRIAKDIVELLDYLEIEEFVYIGHSLGGVIGLYLGSNCRRELKGMVIITAPYELKSTYGGFFFKMLKFALRRNRKIAALMLTPRLFANRKDHRLMDFVRRESATVPVHVLINVGDHNKNIDLWDQLDKINKPVLLISGGKDKIVKVKTMEKIASKIKNARHYTIENAGHNAILEEPEKIVRLITTFLSEINY